MAYADKNSFNKIFGGDENWRFAYDPETKRQEFWMGWWDIPSTEVTGIPKVLHQDRVDNFFLDSQGIVHKEFISEGKTVNAEFYKRVMVSPPEVHSTGSSSCFLFSRLSCCTIIRPPKKLQVFANFWPKNVLQPFTTPRTL